MVTVAVLRHHRPAVDGGAAAGSRKRHLGQTALQLDPAGARRRRHLLGRGRRSRLGGEGGRRRCLGRRAAGAAGGIAVADLVGGQHVADPPLDDAAVAVHEGIVAIEDGLAGGQARVHVDPEPAFVEPVDIGVMQIEDRIERRHGTEPMIPLRASVVDDRAMHGAVRGRLEPGARSWVRRRAHRVGRGGDRGGEAGGAGVQRRAPLGDVERIGHPIAVGVDVGLSAEGGGSAGPWHSPNRAGSGWDRRTPGAAPARSTRGTSGARSGTAACRARRRTRSHPRSRWTRSRSRRRSCRCR